VRVYESSPRRQYADVFRAIGAVLDQMRMRQVLLVEVEEGFIAIGYTTTDVGRGNAWGSLKRAQLTFRDADIARELQLAVERRGTAHKAGPYELALRVIGRQVDDLQAFDVLTFHHDANWLLRCLPKAPETRYTLIEFTEDDIVQFNAGHASGRRKTFKRFVSW
jgi:hypothetical protein